MRTVIVLVTCLLSAGCTQTAKYYPPGFKDTVNAAELKPDSVASSALPAETGFNEAELQLFCNNEIAPYCILLPLGEFKEDQADASAVKARHKFLLKKDSTQFTSIEVQAFTIDKKNYYNTQLFYERDKRDVKEGGLGIDTAYIKEANHYYLIKGHLPDYVNMKFVQLNWILEDRIAVYINYDAKEEALWMKRLDAIIKRGASFPDK